MDVLINPDKRKLNCTTKAGRTTFLKKYVKKETLLKSLVDRRSKEIRYTAESHVDKPVLLGLT